MSSHKPDTTTVTEGIALAARAPSIHNTQPWRWELGPSSLRLYTDPSRRLKVADPSGRSMLISCGATLHHLRVAMAAQGWASQIVRLPSDIDPTSDERMLVASLVFDPAEASDHDRALAAAISTRHTDRRTMSSWPVTEEHVVRLVAAAAQHGAVLQPLLGPTDEAVWNRLAAHVERDRALDSAYLAELRDWLRVRADEGGLSTDDGIPVANLVAEHEDVWSADPPERFPAGDLPNSPVEAEPPLSVALLVTTSSDDTLSRLRAGEALSAILLEATRDGLATRLDTQAIEVDLTRTTLEHQVLDGTRSPQILVRVGWPAGSAPVPPTPRRDVHDILDVDEF